MVKIDSPLYPTFDVRCNDCKEGKHQNKSHDFWYDIENKRMPTICQCKECLK